MKHFLYLLQSDNPGKEEWTQRKLLLRANTVVRAPKKGEWVLLVPRAQLQLNLVRIGRIYAVETESETGSIFEYLTLDSFDVPDYNPMNGVHKLVLKGRKAA